MAPLQRGTENAYNLCFIFNAIREKLIMAEQHSSKSIMYTVIGASIVLMLVAVPFAFTGKPMGAAGGAAEDVDARIAPVAHVELQAAAPKGDGQPRDGKTVYTTICAACHGTGAAGAPKAGDKAAWAPRMAQGMATLLKSATNGKNAMPPKGGAADLSDAELKAAVEYLAGQAK